jgi:ComF family protein
MKSIFKDIIETIIPPTCPGCHSPIEKDHTVCPSCWKRLTFISAPFCNNCSEPLEVSAISEESYSCGSCLKSAPYFSQARALFKYSGLARDLILNLKHGNKTHLSTLFGYMMFSHYSAYIRSADFIIPVPLHWSRLVKRSYNQAFLIAKSIAFYSGKTSQSRILIRKKRTASQGKYGKSERMKNVKAAFSLSPKHKNIIENKTVLLVDDVMASGATLNECSKVLLTAKAKEVKVLVVAKSTLNL